MKEGDVILTPVPQADGKLKERPAIFLREMPPYRDLLVCGVSDPRGLRASKEGCQAINLKSFMGKYLIHYEERSIKDLTPILLFFT